MSKMFSKAKSFNQDLSSWNTISVLFCSYFANEDIYTLDKPKFVSCDVY